MRRLFFKLLSLDKVVLAINDLNAANQSQKNQKDMPNKNLITRTPSDFSDSLLEIQIQKNNTCLKA